MNGPREYATKNYGPMKEKTFLGALNAFFKQECPHLGGDRIRKVLVQSIAAIVDQFYPETSHLRPGQISWVTVDKGESPGFGKRASETRLRSVILDLILASDVDDRIQRKHVFAIRQEAVARLCKQADEQGGCLTTAELCVLLKASSSEVQRHIAQWEEEHQELLPRRGTIHDMGPSITHKRVIVEKLFLEGKSVEQVMRETNHGAEAIHRYIVAFKQVVLCRKKGLTDTETAFAVKMSAHLVREYDELIVELSKKNPAFEKSLANYLDAVLKPLKKSGK